MKEGKSVSKQLAKELYSNSEFLSMKLKINGEEIEIGGREHPEQLSTYTSTDKSLSNFYMKKYQNKLQEEKNVPLSDPVFSGYFGGANQYPIIREALFASFSFEKKGFTYGMDFLKNKLFRKTSWSEIKRLKGLNIWEKSALYKESTRVYNRAMNSLNQVENAGNYFFKLRSYFNWGKVITGQTESQKEYDKKITSD